MANKKKKKLKTFTVHECDNEQTRYMSKMVMHYKHIENMLNILLNEVKPVDGVGSWERFNLLLNSKVMKAVIIGNNGGPKTRDSIAKVRLSFKNNAIFDALVESAKTLNDKNISMIVRRLKKDWDNAFEARSKYFANPSAFTGEPKFPKPKKLSKLIKYSVPLESSKFSLNKEGYLGITMGRKMRYIHIGKPEYITSKQINNVTVSYSHGHIYYEFTYNDISKPISKRVSNNDLAKLTNPVKLAAIDIGVANLLSLYVNDKDTKSLIFSGKALVSYNCYFNKTLAKLNEDIANEAITFRAVTYKDKTDGTSKIIQVPETYTNRGKHLIKNRHNLFEDRDNYFNDVMQKISKKMIRYLLIHNIDILVISRNLSFAKSTGKIKKSSKINSQKFFQIPFGKFLNLLESKAIAAGIVVEVINEAFTSMTSSLTANVVDVQRKSKNKEVITPNDLNGNRGVKKKNVKHNKLGRGLFRDTVLNKVINADLNAALNHLKVYSPNNVKEDFNMELWKFCNPIKIKSNHEFDMLLKYRIVDTKLGRPTQQIPVNT